MNEKRSRGGQRIPRGIRPRQQLRAYDDEWAQIKRLHRILKFVSVETVAKYLDKMEEELKLD